LGVQLGKSGYPRSTTLCEDKGGSKAATVDITIEPPAEPGETERTIVEKAVKEEAGERKGDGYTRSNGKSAKDKKKTALVGTN